MSCPTDLAPIFIPSKGRHDVGLTWKALDAMGIDRYRVIVEPQEYELYASVLPEEKLLTLDMDFKRRYEVLDGVPFEENPRTGSGPARNYGWEIAKMEGHAWHWIIDDNIRNFHVLNNNYKHKARFDTLVHVERFAQKYENVTMAGMQYAMFKPRKQQTQALSINTRIFSCNLIRTDAPFRWRGRYNEDVILSLDMLSAGYCTLLFNAYLCDKMATQKMKGGNTSEIYQDGTQRKSELLKSVYPDNVELIEKYGRHHHKVDYGIWKYNKLIRKNEPTEPQI